MSIRKLMAAILGAVIVALLAGLFWFDQHFEEPSAKHVSSLTKELGAKSVMLVFAHPDDEQLVTGLILRSVKSGATTRMITSTKGERGTPMPQISRIEDLGFVRKAETLKNSYALGVEEHYVWDYPDGKMPSTDYNEYVQRIQAQMEEWKPELVVTFWPESGFSNHKDHMMAGRATTQAVENIKAKNPQIAPQAIAYIVAPRKMMEKFGGERGKIIAANQPMPNYSVPGEGWAKIRGWKIHASQRDFVKNDYGFPAWFVHRIYDKEHYYVVEAENLPH